MGRRTLVIQSKTSRQSVQNRWYVLSLYSLFLLTFFLSWSDNMYAGMAWNMFYALLHLTPSFWFDPKILKSLGVAIIRVDDRQLESRMHCNRTIVAARKSLLAANLSMLPSKAPSSLFISQNQSAPGHAFRSYHRR
jgi:hypothetical protein